MAQLIRSVESAELSALQDRFGALPRRHVRLQVDSPFLDGEHQMLTKDGRRAEICYVMHQGDPAQGLLLHIKTIYPAGAYRLPTGGVQVGEGVLETLAREIEEETGLVVGEQTGQVQVQDCLGLISYELHHHSLNQVYPFATYHFLVRAPTDPVLAPQDATERICGWQWRPAAEMTVVADRLEEITQKRAYWTDWGRYRALSHRFVAQTLAGRLT